MVGGLDTQVIILGTVVGMTLGTMEVGITLGIMEVGIIHGTMVDGTTHGIVVLIIHDHITAVVLDAQVIMMEGDIIHQMGVIIALDQAIME